jgi:6-phospho-beta-glucosidase
VSATTDRRAGLQDCDAILTSYRPGGFEARVLDEKVPLRHGVIGQETQGPGGFFMALRSIAVMQGILDDAAVACPGARIFNYTNPVNLVAQAVTDHSDMPFVSLCEGPILYPEMIAAAAGLDPGKLDVASVGLNHGSWSVRHTYDGQDVLPLLLEAWERRRNDPELNPTARRMLRLATVMGALPSEYFQYYYFEDEVLGELQAKPTTRAEDILSWVPGYWDHYVEQSRSDRPMLDPGRSRGGIHELELAIDCMDAVYNDRGETLPVNVPNQGSIPGFPDSLVVETLGRCDADGVQPLRMPGLPTHLKGLVEALAEYQQAAADAAWSGDAQDGIRALAAHPLVRSVDVAERLYRELAAAHRAHLPERLIPA